MGKINLTLTGVLAVFAFVFTLGAGPIHAQVRHYMMPACPIKQTTVPPTKTVMQLPKENPNTEPFHLAGTMQITDQSGGVISKTAYDLQATSTQVLYNRTVNTIQHMTGSLAFDRGCAASDPYGSNKCTWTWGQSFTAAYQAALQEDITAGKFIVDLKVNDTPVQANGPVCDYAFTIFPPRNSAIAQPPAQWYNIWDLMTRITRFWIPFLVVTPLLDH